jgi:hypothetical protein
MSSCKVQSSCCVNAGQKSHSTVSSESPADDGEGGLPDDSGGRELSEDPGERMVPDGPGESARIGPAGGDEVGDEPNGRGEGELRFRRRCVLFRSNMICATFPSCSWAWIRNVISIQR